MSVQVRRRREAAAFLATYVGAQGELLVDTTNNRVQVHDGATAGGWPAAAVGDLGGRNAAVNGTFAINQRGYASNATLGAGAYAHDRWKAGAGGCVYAFTQTVPDTVATIASGTLVQMVDAPNLYATSYWLSWTGTAGARVWQGSASGPFSAGTRTIVCGIVVNALLVTGLTLGAITALEFSTGTFGLVQFEAALPSAGPTRFERRHYGQELSLCKRYYAISAALSGGYGQASTFTVAFTYPVTMRVAPTLVILNGSVNGGSALELFTQQHVVSGFTSNAAILNTTGGRVDLALGSAARSAQIPGVLEAGTLGFNAEI